SAATAVPQQSPLVPYTNALPIFGVAETFLRRWFGGKPSAPAADEARAEIDRVLADRPELRGPLAWLREILDDLVPVPGLASVPRSEEHTSELQSPCNLVCRLLLE